VYIATAYDMILRALCFREFLQTPLPSAALRIAVRFRCCVRLFKMNLEHFLRFIVNTKRWLVWCDIYSQSYHLGDYFMTCCRTPTVVIFVTAYQSWFIYMLISAVDSRVQHRSLSLWKLCAKRTQCLCLEPQLSCVPPSRERNVWPNTLR